MRILVTGFEPFGGDAENASQQAVAELKRLCDAQPPQFRLVTATLPVTFAGSGRVLRELAELHSPDVILSIGEAGGRSAITPELRAQNLDNARIPDNDGDQPLNQPIDPDGQDLGTQLDVQAIVEAIRAEGLPAEPSEDAGLFVCNHTFYEAARIAAERGIRAGFIHVPAVRSEGVATVGRETDDDARTAASAAAPKAGQQPAGQLTFEDLGRGLRAALEAIASPEAGPHSSASQAAPSAAPQAAA